MQRDVEPFGLRVRGPVVFSRIRHFEQGAFVDSNLPPSFGAETYAVHLFRQMWVHEGVDPDGRFSDTCVYEQWRRCMSVAVQDGEQSREGSVGDR